MTQWKQAWRWRCKTKAAQKEKRARKIQAHRAARRADGIVRLDGWLVI